MGRHTGKNGIVKVGGTAIGDSRGWALDENASNADLTAAGDVWEDHEVLYASWSGTVNFLLNWDNSGQDIRAGSIIALELYSEGDNTGRTYWSGSASVEGVSDGAPYDGQATKDVTFKGKGALTRAVVA